MGLMPKDFTVKDLPSYKISSELSQIIYDLVKTWSYLDQKTIGTQLIRAIDSVAANIAEGFGRYHKKDKIKFYYNARASTIEAEHWVETALNRKLIDKGLAEKILNPLRKLPKEINYLIKMTNNNLSI